MQGWAVDFIPKILEDARKANAYDNILHVDGDDAIKTSRDLAVNEGILTGISGGGTLSAALKLAQSLPAGESVLAVLADTGERYMSTALFDGIPAGMTMEESYMDATTMADDPPLTPLLEATTEAIEFVQNTINKHKVSVFCIKYSEGTVQLKQFLESAKIDSHMVYLDDIKYTEDNMGSRYKAAINDLVKSRTLPQLFVGGDAVGGPHEVFAMWMDGILSEILDNAGVTYAVCATKKTLDYLPESVMADFLHQGKKSTSTVTHRTQHQSSSKGKVVSKRDARGLKSSRSSGSSKQWGTSSNGHRENGCTVSWPRGAFHLPHVPRRDSAGSKYSASSSPSTAECSASSSSSGRKKKSILPSRWG